jgi:hypothetical protein
MYKIGNSNDHKAWKISTWPVIQKWKLRQDFIHLDYPYYIILKDVEKEKFSYSAIAYTVWNNSSREQFGNIYESQMCTNFIVLHFYFQLYILLKHSPEQNDTHTWMFITVWFIMATIIIIKSKLQPQYID